MFLFQFCNIENFQFSLHLPLYHNKQNYDMFITLLKHFKYLCKLAGVLFLYIRLGNC